MVYSLTSLSPTLSAQEQDQQRFRHPLPQRVVLGSVKSLPPEPISAQQNRESDSGPWYRSCYTLFSWPTSTDQVDVEQQRTPALSSADEMRFSRQKKQSSSSTREEEQQHNLPVVLSATTMSFAEFSETERQRRVQRAPGPDEMGIMPSLVPGRHLATQSNSWPSNQRETEDTTNELSGLRRLGSPFRTPSPKMMKARPTVEVQTNTHHANDFPMLIDETPPANALRNTPASSPARSANSSESSLFPVIHAMPESAIAPKKGLTGFKLPWQFQGKNKSENLKDNNEDKKSKNRVKESKKNDILDNTVNKVWIGRSESQVRLQQILNAYSGTDLERFRRRSCSGLSIDDLAVIDGRAIRFDTSDESDDDDATSEPDATVMDGRTSRMCARGDGEFDERYDWDFEPEDEYFDGSEESDSSTSDVNHVTAFSPTQHERLDSDDVDTVDDDAWNREEADNYPNAEWRVYSNMSRIARKNWLDFRFERASEGSSRTYL
jgi:hypothetical protein